MFFIVPPRRWIFVLNRYQLPHTPRIRGDLLPERNLRNMSNFQRFPKRQLTFVPSFFDPHQDRSSALFVEPQKILPLW